MDKYEYIILPNIGDLIAFTELWSAGHPIETNSRYPYGIVTGIRIFKNLYNNPKTRKDMVTGTLAYPLAIGVYDINISKVFQVEWATNITQIVENYRYINEEWFYNCSFRIVSRIKRH